MQVAWDPLSDEGFAQRDEPRELLCCTRVWGCDGGSAGRHDFGPDADVEVVCVPAAHSSGWGCVPAAHSSAWVWRFFFLPPSLLPIFYFPGPKK